MDVFHLRDRIIDDYADYIGSFINIKDSEIRQQVDEELHNGLLWPKPLLQLNPSFEPGPWITTLVDQRALHSECRNIFKIKELGREDRPLRLHKHQADAIEAAASGDNYVLTTGTGSGKSLAYIIPIVNFVLKEGSGRGIRAVVIYPMNALANSQANELEKFLCRGYPEGQPPVTFRRYTGQESDEERQEILTNPPDILLTNYVMLELMFTRPYEKKIVAALRERLQFLVLDELHTYRGRQGADVALLVRRVREACANPKLQSVGTSATLAGAGTFLEQQQEVADLATRLFGVTVHTQRVIGETLRRVTNEYDFQDPAQREQLTQRVATHKNGLPASFDDFRTDFLASWIESTFGLTTESASGRLKRATPVSISGDNGAAHKLAQLTLLPDEECEQAIQAMLLAGYTMQHPETGFPLFAFRLHQFISRGDTVYASLESADQRFTTTQKQQYVPNDRSRILLPIAFCRECGQEYYTVYRVTDSKSGTTVYQPRTLTDQTDDRHKEASFLYTSRDNPWPADRPQQLERLPEDWLELTGSGLEVKRANKTREPKRVLVNPLGQESSEGMTFHYVKSPFAFCLNCGVTYSGRQRSDYGKLSVLSSEGRSTATTVLSLSTLRSLRQNTSLKSEARKLLSFTDNRQDASLQAGHFNDFIEVGMLRTALYQSVQKVGDEGITHEVMPQRVFEAMQLPLEQYAVDPTVKFAQKTETERALREVLAYRIYQDLRRGWRVTSPNLEQCGLLRIDYLSLAELCAAEEEWNGFHPALADAAPETRQGIARTLLDYLRRELAIKVDYLDPIYQETLRQRSSQRLKEPWAIDENERLLRSYVAFPRATQPGDSGECVYVSGRGGFGIYLRRQGTLPHYTQKLSTEETETIIAQLFVALRVAGLVQIVQDQDDKSTVPGYQIPASSLVWRVGDGITPVRDLIRVPRAPSNGARTNPYFVDFYRQSATGLHGFRAREHTAQVPSDERLIREELFRKAQLPLLYCSPTMELGVDIAQLNAVNMRNVPPTPANYAQRSGRAGRSGQPALVLTYCTTGSPHDQYFFKRPQNMVAGSVTPPRIDLANEDLVRAHVHAVWLAETGLSLGTSLMEVLDVAGDHPTLELLPSVRDAIRSSHAKLRTQMRVKEILAGIEKELAQAGWYTDQWLARVLEQVENEFDRACDRWRQLYRSAMQQREVQNKIIGDATRSQPDKEQAKRLRSEAESQMELLTSSKNLLQSDFYSYRYFASEGFLPGYNFPRLPLSAYIPGRRANKNDQDEYLNRPRFLAISEFGPRSIIYHEGSRYVVNRVILPADLQSEHGIITSSAKLCPDCGHLHPIQEGSYNPDRCEQCNALLDGTIRSLMRMQNVSTRRRDRINSDEEERMRMGYELVTAVRLERGAQQTTTRVATVYDGAGGKLLHLTYGHAATIWRINKGWRRRKPEDPPGFVLDTEKGFWAKQEDENEEDANETLGPRKQRVVPYVEDRRNCLLIEPAMHFSKEVMASLQPALKNAIQVLYQVEDGEIAVEPLPHVDERRLILLYEAAEGGAGVLRQLLDEPTAMAEVARMALQICHFEPENGADLRRAPNAREDCESACYDCLLSYTNQPDHLMLDRHLVRDFLLHLAQSHTQDSPVALSRAEHAARLKQLCDSDFERRWLDFLDAQNLHLPDAAQARLAGCNTVADFYYSDKMVAIYIDGIHHNYAEVAAADRQITTCLEDAGYTVIRFGNQTTWQQIVQEHRWLFGENGT